MPHPSALIASMMASTAASLMILLACSFRCHSRDGELPRECNKSLIIRRGFNMGDALSGEQRRHG